MSITRRDFLLTGLTAGAIAATPRWLQAAGIPSAHHPLGSTVYTDPYVRELALRAVDAARAAGASYADVRLTHTRALEFITSSDMTEIGSGVHASETAFLGVGVRALVDGTWGFAASAVWTPDETVRLGREAVELARTYAAAKQRRVELGQIPVINNGEWSHTVEHDAFETPDGEMRDFMAGVAIYVDRKVRGSTKFDLRRFVVTFRRQDKAFASSEGSYCTQRLYQTGGVFWVGIKGDQTVLSSPIIAGASRGWEYIREAPLREEAHRMSEEMLEDLSLPEKPVEVGRYDVVFDAESMAALLDGTLGCATELDRALGYEANAGGTSYLNDPFGMIGSYQAGAPFLTITADRTAPGGLATVKWDDDGVEPDTFALVKDGTLVDFQTHREAAGGWFPGGPRRSHGCAGAPRAFDAPLIHSPNLTMTPAREAFDFDGLVGGIKRGIAVKQLRPRMDFQCLNGVARGRTYEVKDGKRVARIVGEELLFRAPEFWKGLLALGGSRSQRRFALQREKGEPMQAMRHTVTAVPGVVRQLSVILRGR